VSFLINRLRYCERFSVILCSSGTAKRNVFRILISPVYSRISQSIISACSVRIFSASAADSDSSDKNSSNSDSFLPDIVYEFQKTLSNTPLPTPTSPPSKVEYRGAEVFLNILDPMIEMQSICGTAYVVSFFYW
jgi:hypothetical protein